MFFSCFNLFPVVFFCGFPCVKSFQVVLGRWWMCCSVSDGVKAVVGVSKFSGLFWWVLDGCSRCTSSVLLPFVVCRLKCHALHDLVGPNLRRLRHWRDPGLALALSCSFALGAPQFDAPQVCTVLSHVSSAKKKFYILVCFHLVLSCSVCFELFQFWVVLSRFRSSICVLLFELVILLFVVFIRFGMFLFMMCSVLLQMVFGSFSRSCGVGLRCFCAVFGSFNFLWIGFGFRGCFRLLKVVSSFQLCEVCFTLLFFCGWLWVVLGCCR